MEHIGAMSFSSFSSAVCPSELSSLKLTPLLTNLSATVSPARDIFTLIFDGNTPPLDECKFVLRYYEGPSAEMFQALELFALSRCELPNNGTSAETLLPETPLQALRLVLES